MELVTPFIADHHHHQVGIFNYFLDKDLRYYFTITDPAAEFTFARQKITVPILRTFYTTQRYRNYGYNSRILRRLLTASDESGVSFCCVANAFEIDGLKDGDDAADALEKAQTPGFLLKPDGWLFKTKQIVRRRFDLGFFNLPFDNAIETESWQQLFYLSGTAPEKERVVVEGLRIETGKQETGRLTC